jgi:Flp pilus assembly protein TadB
MAAPLFAVAIVAAMFGVVAGAFATWLSQGRHRRASRQSRLEANKWRAHAEAMKAAQNALKLNPNLPEAWLAMSAVLGKQGKTQEDDRGEGEDGDFQEPNHASLIRPTRPTRARSCPSGRSNDPRPARPRLD